MLSITNHQGNTNENHSELTPHLSEWLSSKRTQRTHIGKDVEKRELSHTNDGNVNWCNHCGKIMKDTQKIKIRTTITCSSSTLENISKENESTDSKRYIYPNIHISIIYNSQDVEEG